MDIFNSRVYKNANIALLGTPAGKYFSMQLMALRMRRKNIQVFIIAPLKGMSSTRPVPNIGGIYPDFTGLPELYPNIMEIRNGQGDE